MTEKIISPAYSLVRVNSSGRWVIQWKDQASKLRVHSTRQTDLELAKLYFAAVFLPVVNGGKVDDARIEGRLNTTEVFMASRRIRRDVLPNRFQRRAAGESHDEISRGIRWGG